MAGGHFLTNALAGLSARSTARGWRRLPAAAPVRTAMRTCLAVLLLGVLTIGPRPLTARASDVFTDALLGVACPSPSNCFAVGYSNLGDAFYGGRGPGPLIEHWTGSRWSRVESPLAKLDTGGSLNGIACPGPRFCVAVGWAASDQPYSGQSLIEAWRGGKWSVMSWSSYSGQLASVSCSRPSSCMSVGEYEGCNPAHGCQPEPLTEHWNGEAWSVDQIPYTPGTGAWLLGVDCPGSNTCFVLGGYGWFDGSEPGAVAQTSANQFVDHWNGSAWSPSNLALPPQAYLVGISCPDRRSCIVVGSETEGSATRTLVERWNGSTWSRRWSANPAGAAALPCGGAYNQGPESFYVGNACLAAVSCATPTSCVAVGEGTDHTVLIERWNGSTWSIEPSRAAPLALYSALSGVFCTVSRCLAAGAFMEGSITSIASTLTLVESWSGGRWSIVPSPNRPSKLTYLGAVDCREASRCLAVGDFTNPDSGRMPMLSERWDGKAWSPVPNSNPSGFPFKYFNSLSCWTIAGCFSAGYEVSPDSRARTLIDRWNGASWSRVLSPNPKGWSVTELFGVSCRGPSNCFAVGDRARISYHQQSWPQTLVEHWNGRRWSVVGSPNVSTVPGTTNDLYGVSCPGPRTCFAVGDGIDPKTNAWLPVIQRWNGVRWRIVSSPPFAGSDASGSLRSVSCTSISNCFAVGTGIERWNGGAWSSVAMPTPSEAFYEGTYLVDVTCLGPSRCIAVGNYGTRPLIEGWDGTAWSIVPSPKVVGGANPAQLTGVSCANPSSCFAVGYYETATSELGFIEHWNGAVWSLVSSPEL